MSTTKDATYQEFLKGLKVGDKVLVCHKDGELYEDAVVQRAENGKIRLLKTLSPYVPLTEVDVFSAKTGKAQGCPLYVQPYDDALYQAHEAQVSQWRREAEQERKEHQAKKRNALLLAVSGATAEGIEYERLERLSTSELEALSVILGKLKGE